MTYEEAIQHATWEESFVYALGRSIESHGRHIGALGYLLMLCTSIASAVLPWGSFVEWFKAWLPQRETWELTAGDYFGDVFAIGDRLGIDPPIGDDAFGVVTEVDRIAGTYTVSFA